MQRVALVLIFEMSGAAARFLRKLVQQLALLDGGRGALRLRDNVLALFLLHHVGLGQHLAMVTPVHRTGTGSDSDCRCLRKDRILLLTIRPRVHRATKYGLRAGQFVHHASISFLVCWR